MKKIFLQSLPLVASLFMVVAGAHAASVGTSGYTNAFTTQPPAADWATVSWGAGSVDLQTAADLDTAVQTNLASGITALCNGANGNPPDAAALAVWSTNGYLQTRPTGNAYTLLMATLVNATGTNATRIRISYDFSAVSPAIEVVYGHLVYYSLTGAANSWWNLAMLQSTNSGTLSTNIALPEVWNDGATLFLLVADENGQFTPDTANQIDNFVVPIAAPIAVGIDGSGIITFDTFPPVEQWATFSVRGSSIVTHSNADFDLSMTTNGAANIVNALGSQAGSGTSANAYWRSGDFKLGTQPTGNGETLLMATLINTSGTTISNLNISYVMGVDLFAAETNKGHRVYYSLTGDTNTWTAIDDAHMDFPGTSIITFTVSSLGWAANTKLFIVWLDDNGGNNPDGDYSIDDISFTSGDSPVTIAISNPTNGQTFHSTADAAVTATASGSISNVAFFVDGTFVATDATAPYAATVPRTMLPEGLHNLTAFATNRDGTVTASAAVSILITPNLPPSITISNGVTEVLVGTAITNRATITDDVGYTNVDWFVDGVFRLRGLNTRFIHNDSLAGTHTFQATVSDRGGLTASSTIVTVTVTNPPANFALLVTNGSDWKYYANNSEPPADGSGLTWFQVGYDDSAWTNSLAELGNGDTADGYPETSMIDIGVAARYPTIYFRKTFQSGDPHNCDEVVLRLLRDDGAVVHLNGQPVWINNIAVTTSPIVYTNLANSTSDDDGTVYQVLSISPEFLVAGENTVAVEVHQQTTNSSDLSFDLMIWVNTPPPTLTCSNDKTVLCGANWTFDLPTVEGGCCGTNFTLTILSTLTNSLCPPIFTRTWQAGCETKTATCRQTVTLVDQPPLLLAGPISQVVTCGCTVDFFIWACGGLMTYQWYHNGAPIPNETNAVLTILRAQHSDAGEFSVVVLNPCGSLSNGPVTLAVSCPPVDLALIGPAFPQAVELYSWNTAWLIYTYRVTNQGAFPAPNVVITNFVTQPQIEILDVWAAEGGTVGLDPQVVPFEVGRLDPGEFLDIWVWLQSADFGFRSGEHILFTAKAVSSGEDTTPANNLLNRDWYSVFAPVIQIQPASQTVPPGGNASLSVTVYPGCALPLSYQWRFNGAELPGKTTSALALTAITPQQYGDYSVRIANSYGATVSAAAALFGGAGFAPNLHVTMTTLSGTIEVNGQVSYSATVSNPGGPATQCWLTNAFPAGFEILSASLSKGSFSVTNSVSLLADLGALAFGQSVDLHVTGRVPGSGSFGLGAVAVPTPVDANPSDNSATVTVQTGDLPVIARQPMSQTVEVFSPVSFTVGASASSPITYQWRFNDEEIPGAATATLALSEATTKDAGIYDVVLSTTGGSVTSAPATLTLTYPAAVSSTLTGGALRVAGTAGPDHIELRLKATDATRLEVVTVTGGTSSSQEHLLASVTRLILDAGSGNDTIVVQQNVDDALPSSARRTLISGGTDSYLLGTTAGLNGLQYAADGTVLRSSLQALKSQLQTIQSSTMNLHTTAEQIRTDGMSILHEGSLAFLRVAYTNLVQATVALARTGNTNLILAASNLYQVAVTGMVAVASNCLNEAALKVAAAESLGFCYAGYTNTILSLIAQLTGMANAVPGACYSACQLGEIPVTPEIYNDFYKVDNADTPHEARMEQILDLIETVNLQFELQVNNSETSSQLCGSPVNFLAWGANFEQRLADFGATTAAAGDSLTTAADGFEAAAEGIRTEAEGHITALADVLADRAVLLENLASSIETAAHALETSLMSLGTVPLGAGAQAASQQAQSSSSGCGCTDPVSFLRIELFGAGFLFGYTGPVGFPIPLKITALGPSFILVVGKNPSLIYGSSQTDFIVGCEGNDVVHAGGGFDIVFGLAGGDCLEGEGGIDILIGGAGDDTLSGGDDNDLLIGWDGDDTLCGGQGYDVLIGGAGSEKKMNGDEDSDFLFGGTGNDMMNGGDGTAFSFLGQTYILGNLMLGGDDDDTMTSGDGIDVMLGQVGGDTMAGGGNIDLMFGGSGVDIMNGGDGGVLLTINGVPYRLGNVMFGGTEGDTMVGGIDLDLIFGQAGGDTINGGDGAHLLTLIVDDLLFGGTENDTIDGGTGSDWIWGYDGVDTLYGDKSQPLATLDIDWIFGGSGIDTIHGNGGINLVFGGTDNDSIYGAGGGILNLLFGNGGADDIYAGGLLCLAFGNDGADSMFGSDGLEILFGNQGDDTIYGNDGTNVIFGNQGDDVLRGGSFLDLLVGNGGNDQLYGGTGSGLLLGNDGLDDLYGGDGLDLLLGGDGSDCLYGQDGTDLLFGGSDNDYLEGGIGLDLLFGGDNNDELLGGPGLDLLVGGNGNDRLFGEDDLDLLFGGSGNDRLDGGNGPDAGFFGGDGNDVLLGGPGLNLLVGGDGNDGLVGGGSVNILLGGLGNDILYGGGDTDFLLGGSGADQIFSGAGNDFLFGGTGNDCLAGGDGNDFLFGGDGNDTLYGENGNDFLFGNGDADTLWGGANTDFLFGGPGFDQLNGGPDTDFLFNGRGGGVKAYQADQSVNCVGASYGEVHGFVWVDTDGDGYKDANEVGVAGIQVRLTAQFPPNSVFNVMSMPDDPATCWNELGEYWHLNLAPGKYRVELISAAPWVQTYPTTIIGRTPGTEPTPGYYTVDLGAGQSIEGINFAISNSCRATIVTHPQSQTVRGSTNAATYGVTGSNLTFIVAASNNCASPINYQWLFNGMSIPGATNTSLTLSNVTLANEGTYAALVANSAGSQLSSNATLFVLLSPHFSQHPQSVTLALGSTLNLNATVVGGPLPMGFRWRRNGSTLTNYLLNSLSSTHLVPNIQFNNAGSWTVVVTNLATPPSILSSSAIVTVVAGPTNQIVNPGATATLRVTATNNAGNAFRYQWQFNGANMTDATNSSLMLTNVEPTNAGTYTVVVSIANAVVPPASFSATLQVITPRIAFIELQWLPDGKFRTVLIANAGRSYEIETSSDLIDWVNWVTIDATNELTPLLDDTATNSSYRFYRARQVP